ncbi:MAG: Ferredoxin, 2Fe-2S [uncultured Sphingomonas sp.]|uniref:Ferredoxin, 2Fe-2S n=1 Tax=uncultured Sphingomonas sp. TaxID=158754 RepID=A0A6J4TC10_9SPHN|nr:2Fe-2S iron-sulfur cluster-binding protein [uncultured Sphingomonas sp.]CAA9518734.1 MAG: Ferredoxin, 2Fe-2S [uncultured Sphingomonas sp.]
MHLFVTTRDGQEIQVEATADLPVMNIIRDAGIDELVALCGGCLSCATCHVYVDDEQLSMLPPMSDDEDDLLDSSNARKASSRLSCQIPFQEQLAGLKVTIASED